MLPATPGYTILKDPAGAPLMLGEDAWGTTYKAFHHAMNCASSAGLSKAERATGFSATWQFIAW